LIIMLGLRVGHPRLFSRPGKDGMAAPRAKFAMTAEEVTHHDQR
jgi:hypothetical protein